MAVGGGDVGGGGGDGGVVWQNIHLDLGRSRSVRRLRGRGLVRSDCGFTRRLERVIKHDG